MKKLFVLFVIICISLITSVQAFALSMHSGETAYTTRYEFEYNPNVSTYGSWGVSSDGKAIWQFSQGTYSVTNSPMQLLAGQTLYVQFWYSDWNDGYAGFYTKAQGGSWVYQGSLQTHEGGQQYALIDGLTAGLYDLKIISEGRGVHCGDDDLHLGHYGAKGSAPVPEPSTILLLGLGLVGAIGMRKKFKK